MQGIKRCMHHKIVRSKNESERWSGQLELILLKSQIKYAIKKSSASYFCERKVECKSVAFGLVRVQPSARIHRHFVCSEAYSCCAFQFGSLEFFCHSGALPY